METRGDASLALRREAHKALSSRVPAFLSLAIALLTGALAGYGVRAFAVEDRPDAAARPVRAPHRTCLVLPPVISTGAPRVILLGQAIQPAPPAPEPSARTVPGAAAATFPPPATEMASPLP